MRFFCKAIIVFSLATVPLCGAFAQRESNASPLNVADKKQNKKTSQRLTKKDRKVLVALALDGRVREEDESDCSHLVHTIYETAGFPYEYAPSDDLYAGVGSFYQVKAPLAGDLVVWRGHVGMVIKPSKHTFFSSLSSGPGTGDYETPYWKSRGQPRFYRYIKKVIARKTE
jgi:cell wall-associated NlpC family hydrolase